MPSRFVTEFQCTLDRLLCLGCQILSGVFLCWIWLFSLGVVPSNSVTWLTGVLPLMLYLLEILAVLLVGRLLLVYILLSLDV